MNRSFLNAASWAHPGAAKSVLYGALEPAFATLHPEGSQAHTHTKQHCPGTGQSHEATPARLAAGGGEAGEVPETPTSCLSFGLHYEGGGPESFHVTGTEGAPSSGHHCVFFVGFNFPCFVSLR